MIVIRLDKYLADMQVGTRNEVKTHIKKGQVKINDLIVKRPEEKVKLSQDIVKFLDRVIAYEAFVYFMLNKPAGIVSATEDNVCETVLDLFSNEPYKGLFPVGRLDKDTEGLLLITNDGMLAHNLLSPKKHVPKTYYAKIDGKVTDEDTMRFEQGIDIGDEKPALPAKLNILSWDGTQSEIFLTITEGRFHQVKRMFHAISKNVIYLKRIAMGELKLDENLPEGSYRVLTEAELQILLKGSSK